MASPQVQIAGKPRAQVRMFAMLALAVALGLALQHVVQSRLDGIAALADENVIRARGELAGMLRGVAVGVFGVTGALGVVFGIACCHAHREQRFPPSGRWSWTATRVVTGPRARLVARIGIGLAGALVAVSILGGTLTWYVASVLLACRAT
jgi:hypothetical protein